MMRYRKRPLADAVRGDAFGDAPRALSAADDVVTQLPAQAAAGRPAGGPAAHAPRRGLRSPLTPRKWDRTGSNSSVMQPHPYVTVPFT